MAETAKSHLAQQQLSAKDKMVFDNLREWLPKARFAQPPDTTEICVDNKLPQKWEILTSMDLLKEV